VKLVNDLEAAQDGVLWGPVTMSTTASEVCLFVVQYDPQLPIQVPVEVEAPGLSHSGSAGRIGEEGKGSFVDVKRSVPGANLERAPGAPREIKGPGW
jgi:hypothetical protein